MEYICRVCMEASGVFTNIFDGTQKLDTSIADMISECTGYAVRRGDSLPENICLPCLEDAASAFKLKKTCEQSHKLYFARMEEDRGEYITSDKLEDNDWEPSDGESEQLNQFESDAKVQSDKDVEHLFKCSHCPKRYSLKGNLNRHMQLHTAEEPFKCSECSKSFKLKCYLRAHTNAHCLKLKLKYHLQEHSRTHTADRPYHCSHCSMSFTQKFNFQAHIRRHTGDRPFQCSHCSKSFKTKNHLEAHTRTHTGDRPFQCSHCSKSFNQKSHLRTHTNSHCLKSLKLKSQLQEHSRTHTNATCRKQKGD